MAGVWHNEGENNVLEAYFSGANRPADSWYLGLYTNNSALTESATLATITEPSDAGYSRQALLDEDWTVTNDQAEATQQVFEPSASSITVYGWFLATVSSGTSGKLLASEHFPSGPYIVPVGGNIKVTPKITAS